MIDHTPTATGNRTATGDPLPTTAPTAPGAAVVVDLAVQLDALRIAAGKAAALADVTLESYDHADWCGADPALVERTVVGNDVHRHVGAVDVPVGPSPRPSSSRRTRSRRLRSP